MHPIKAKRMMRIVKQLKANYPTVAAELEQVISGAMTPPHPGQALRKAEASLQGAVHKVVDAMSSKEFALAGGFAVAVWIDIRKTYDADFVVLGDTFGELDQIFPGGSHKPLIYTVRIDGEVVDFLKPDLFPWTQEAISAAVEKEFMGRKIKVLTPEYLILYKFQAGRDRDFGDIKALLTLKGVAEKARELVAQYMPEELEDFDQIQMESEYGI